MSDSFLTASLIIVGLCFIVLIVVGTLAMKSMGKNQGRKKRTGIERSRETYSLTEAEFAHNPT